MTGRDGESHLHGGYSIFHLDSLLIVQYDDKRWAWAIGGGVLVGGRDISGWRSIIFIGDIVNTDIIDAFMYVLSEIYTEREGSEKMLEELDVEEHGM